MLHPIVIPSRRVRLRPRTLAEIKTHAGAQVAADGAAALSLNAIARAMAMSGPAIYRYFDSRDDLLAALVVEAYEELAHVMDTAAQSACPLAPGLRFRAACGAYRTWALAHRHRCRLLFSSPAGSGQLAPERTIPAADRNMVVMVDALRDVMSERTAPGALDLGLELEPWAAVRAGHLLAQSTTHTGG